MSNVFFLQDSSRFDTEAARSYGQRIFLFGANLRTPLNPSGLVEDYIQSLREHDFNPDEDYVALTGPVVQLAIFVGVLLRIYDTPIRFLIFDARRGQYEERVLNLTEALTHVQDQRA